MACGCAGKSAVGAGLGVGARVAATPSSPATVNRLVYRILAPGSRMPSDCVVRQDDGSCMNFESLRDAMQYRADTGVVGSPVGVIVTQEG